MDWEILHYSSVKNIEHSEFLAVLQLICDAFQARQALRRGETEEGAVVGGANGHWIGDRIDRVPVAANSRGVCLSLKMGNDITWPL